MKKILICSTILRTIKVFLIPHIQLLKRMGYIVDIAGNRNVDGLEAYVNKVYNIPFKRIPFSYSNISAFRQLKKIVNQGNYDIIHFHTPIASAFGRYAARNVRKKGTKVLYTAHGFHFYKGAPVINWIVYFSIEKWLSNFTDKLITINQEDYLTAKKYFSFPQIEYLPGVGINISNFKHKDIDIHKKRAEIGVPDDAFVLVSVGELNKNKNHIVVIKALAKLNCTKLYYLICGQGSQKNALLNAINKMGLEKQVKLLGYRNDIPEILKMSDLFIFPSRREGLSVSLMEALAVGIPVVCANIRGNNDLVVDKKGGLLIEPNNIKGYSNAINYLYRNPEIRQKMGYFNTQKVLEYDLNCIINKLTKLYQLDKGAVSE